MRKAVKRQQTAVEIIGRKDLARILYAHRAMQGLCWVWRGPKTESGYGLLILSRPAGLVEIVREVFLVHRLAYELWVGPIPRSQGICHAKKCRSRACFNPGHLRTCSRSENERDKIALEV